MFDEIYFFIGINLDLNLEFWVVVVGNGMVRRKNLECLCCKLIFFYIYNYFWIVKGVYVFMIR